MGKKVTSHILLPLTGTRKEILLHLRELRFCGPSACEGDRGPSASSSSLLGIPAHVRNEPEQEPQALLHFAVSPELWEVSHSDLISAPKHWHGAICRYGIWEAMPSGSSIFRLQEAARNTILRCPYPSHGSSVSPRRWTITGTSPNTDTGGGTLQPACIVSRRHRC